MGHFNKSIASPFLAFLMVSGPAAASTLPRVDFSANDKIVAVGLLDVNFDYALTDRLSIGVSMVPYPNTSIAWYDPLLSPIDASIRTTVRLGDVLGATVGFTASAGVNQTLTSGPFRPSLNPFPGLPLLGYTYFSFVQPALNIAIPLGQGEGHWTLRATLGPVFSLAPTNQATIPLWPNLEFSRPLGDHGELTLLGNGLVGWRGIF